MRLPPHVRNAIQASDPPRRGDLALYFDCRMVRTQRREGDPRAFAHVGHRKAKVCIASEALLLSPEHIAGLFLHEMGHLIAWEEWGKSEQRHADRAVQDLLGVRIRYKGHLLLQWVPASRARAILGL